MPSWSVTLKLSDGSSCHAYANAPDMKDALIAAETDLVDPDEGLTVVDFDIEPGGNCDLLVT